MAMIFLWVLFTCHCTLVCWEAACSCRRNSNLNFKCSHCYFWHPLSLSTASFNLWMKWSIVKPASGRFPSEPQRSSAQWYSEKQKGYLCLLRDKCNITLWMSTDDDEAQFSPHTREVCNYRCSVKALLGKNISRQLVLLNCSWKAYESVKSINSGRVFLSSLFDLL